MGLRAVLFDFNGVIVDDEAIHARLISEILLSENLRPQADEYQQFCLGRSDRECLDNVLSRRGRYVNAAYLDKLLAEKSQAYQAELEKLETLPLFPGVEELIKTLVSQNIKLGLVTGALRGEVEWMLQRAGLWADFSTVVTANDVSPGKPDPAGYVMAVNQLQDQCPDLELSPAHCLVIEDTFMGIEAAKRAGLPVLGVAHTFPFHMLQRRCNWAIDRFSELDLDYVQAVYAKKTQPKPADSIPA